MSLSKKNKFKECGIEEKEASVLLCSIIVQDEDIYEQNGEEAFTLISADLASTRKRTIHNRRAFENKAREIINKSKEKINNGDYREVAGEILDLFRDEAKSEMRLYLDANNNIITMVLNLMTLVAAILMPIIVKFLLIQIHI